MLKCLKEKPVEDLVLLTRKFQPFMYSPFTPFGIVVEKESDHAFITEHPYKLIKNGNYNKRPWLVSQVKDEGSYPAAEFYSEEIFLKEINGRWEELAPYILDFYSLSKNDKLKMKISRQVKEFYMGDKEISRKYFQHFNDVRKINLNNQIINNFLNNRLCPIECLNLMPRNLLRLNQNYLHRICTISTLNLYGDWEKFGLTLIWVNFLI
jgi:hypothetical protein